MSQYYYKGKSYRTKTELVEGNNINTRTIANLEKQGMGLYEAMDYVIDRRNRKSELFEKVGQILGTTINSREELEAHLKSIDFKSEPQTLYSLEDKVLFLENLHHTPYYFLIRGKGPFMYEDAEYKSLTSFLATMKIVKPTLFRELVKNNFDVKQSILKCKDDPEYRAKLRPVINSKTYESVKHASRALNINSNAYMRYLRVGLSFQEAYQKCLDNKTNPDRFDSQFPTEIHGVVCKNVEDIASVYKLGVATVKNYMNPYDNLEDFIIEYEEIYNKNLEMRNKDFVMEHYGITKGQLWDLMEENNRDINAVIDKLEMLKFEYEGKILYPYRQQLSEYKLTSAANIGQLRKLLLSTNDQEVKNNLAKDYIDSFRNGNKKLVTTSSIFS